MLSIQNYSQYQFLVADDFSNFRATVSRMLSDMGVIDIDLASNADEIISKCEVKDYDLVLCDYNLGSGRNGQHVLEELRYRKLLDSKAAFVLVSAEANRNIVMCAYDCAPDDYLMKPITGRMLHTRIDRLLRSRDAMGDVYRALAENDEQRAIDLLIDMAIAEDRHSTVAQKKLGELFLKSGEYKKAEKLYRQVLEVRELDWARLGLAMTKHYQGDYDEAGRWLEKIIEDSYLFLPAYDALAKNWQAKGDYVQAQMVVQNSVDVSPMSILRQKILSDLAMQNGDLEVGIEAMRRVVKLGRLSCYGQYQDTLKLASAVSTGIESGHAFSSGLMSDIADQLESAIGGDGQSDDGPSGLAHSLYVSARMDVIRGSVDAAKEKLNRAEEMLPIDQSNIDIEIDHIRLLLSMSSKDKANRTLSALQGMYQYDQHALQRLDEFMDEPVSDVNKTMVADINREGIGLYNSGKFDEALICFDKAVGLFPKHIGLQLNILQALIGKIRSEDDVSGSHTQCRHIIDSIAATIEPENVQYKRFLQLKNMVRTLQEHI